MALYGRGTAERTYYIVQAVAGFEGANLACRIANGLNYQSDCSGFYIGIGNGERYALAVFAAAYDDKVSGLSCTCHFGSLDKELYYMLRKMCFFNDPIHNFLALSCTPVKHDGYDRVY